MLESSKCSIQGADHIPVRNLKQEHSPGALRMQKTDYQAPRTTERK